MVAIDVQEGDLSVRKMRECFIERALDQCGKAPVQRVVMRMQVFKHFRSVKAGLRVTFPGVYRKTARIQLQFLNGLTERAVRVTPVSAEFYDHRWFQRTDQEHPERDMLPPRRDRRQTFRRINENRDIHKTTSPEVGEHVLLGWAQFLLLPAKRWKARGTTPHSSRNASGHRLLFTGFSF